MPATTRFARWPTRSPPRAWPSARSSPRSGRARSAARRWATPRRARSSCWPWRRPAASPKILNKHGVRKYGVIRIDSADSPTHWAADPKGNTQENRRHVSRGGKSRQRSRRALAAEGEICWAGMHSWSDMVDLLEAVDMPDTVGFQADHGPHVSLPARLQRRRSTRCSKPGYSDAEFGAGLQEDDRRPAPLDDRFPRRPERRHASTAPAATTKPAATARPTTPTASSTSSNAPATGSKTPASRGIQHICWDGCMFPNAMLENQQTWNTILGAMIKVRDAHGWN